MNIDVILVILVFDESRERYISHKNMFSSLVKTEIPLSLHIHRMQRTPDFFVTKALQEGFVFDERREPIFRS